MTRIRNSLPQAFTKTFMCTIVIGLLSTPGLMAFTAEAKCQYKSLADHLGPVRDQGNVGWCYANTSADLLTAKYNTKDLGTMSTFQLAMISNYNSEKSLTAEGGSLRDTLKFALRVRFPTDRDDQLLKFGFCPNAMALDPKTSLKTMLADMMEMKTTYDAGKSNPTKSRIFRGQQMRAQRAGYFPVAISDNAFLKLLDESTPRSFLLRYANMICGTQKLYNGSLNVEVTSFDRVNRRELDLIDAITAQIQDGNLVGIEFHADLIQAGGDLEHLLPDNLHAVSVIGQRWQNGTCQLQLRNSWGKACGQKNLKGEVVSRYSKYVEECQDGNIWVSEKNLSQALERITYISNAPSQAR